MPETICHAKNCKAVIKPGYGMCRKHWFMVPPQLRRQIWGSVGTPANLRFWCEAIKIVFAQEGGQENLLEVHE